jgi:type IV pilus assembly protein PilQ
LFINSEDAMKQVWTLIAASGLALSSAQGLAATAGDGASTPAPRAGAVTGVSVLPSAGKADVVVDVDRTADVQDFVLEMQPYRIVLDFTGARLATGVHFYDHIARGGITNVRYSQYKSGIVRVVIELDGPHKYAMTRDDHAVHVTVDADAGRFAAWSSDDVAFPQVSVATASAVATATAPAATDATITPGKAVPTPRETPIVTSSAGMVVPAVQRSAVPIPGHSVLQHATQSTQPRITVTYQDADVRDVLASFAAFSGRTIIVGREVQGTVTAEIRDQPWDVALQSVLSAQQLAASEDQYGIITVDSYKNIQSKQASEPLVTQLVSINYAHAGSLVETVKSLLARDCGSGAAGGAATGTSCLPRGNVVADSGTNSLLITESQSHINDVINYVRDLDIRTPQVSIKAKIVFINRTVANQLGLAYDFEEPNQYFNKLVDHVNPAQAPSLYDPNTYVVNLGGDALAGISNASRPYASSAAINLIYSMSLGKFSLTSFLDALSMNNLSDVQAEPSVVTLDNRPAKIQVGQETPIRVIDASSNGVGGTARATVSFKETGIILEVTPHITNNGQVLMVLHAEQSTLSQTGGDLGYFFFKRYADNQLLVNDGETAVIGGLTQTTVTKQKQGIPFLSDLPLVGGLFSQTSNEEDKQDLLILVTPHILPEGEAVRSASATR